MGGHHGIDHVIKMLRRARERYERQLKGPMSPGENHNQIHQWKFLN